LFKRNPGNKVSFGNLIKHLITKEIVLLILGSLIIGYLSCDTQARGIEPFTADIFKGFLAVFLLDMGITSGKKLPAFWRNSVFPQAFTF
jgi:hypothetical protein